MGRSAKIQQKGQVTIPTNVMRQAGLAKGDLVDFAFAKGKIVITPKVLAEPYRLPNADDEYTPAQRRIVDARLAEADADIEAGRVSPAFNSHEQLIAYLDKVSLKRSPRKPSKRSVK